MSSRRQVVEDLLRARSHVAGRDARNIHPATQTRSRAPAPPLRALRQGTQVRARSFPGSAFAPHSRLDGAQRAKAFTTTGLAIPLNPMS
jgi:hypothetical protein